MSRDMLWPGRKSDDLSANELRDEILFLEGRLRDMSDSADSAYEKLFVRTYDELLQQRRMLLADKKEGANPGR